MKSTAHLPRCLALVICDKAIKEEGNGKWSLIGIFSKIQVGALPALHHSLYIYVALTGGRGEVPIKLTITPVQMQKPLMVAEGMLKVDDPAGVGEFVFGFPQFPLVAEGVYDIRFAAAGEEVGAGSFTVTITRPEHAS